MDLEEMIARLNDTRRHTYQALEGVDFAGVVHTKSGWRVQDVVGHIAVWEVEFNRSLEAYRDGQIYIIPNLQDFEIYNDPQMAQRRDWTPDQVLAELDEARQQMITLLRALPDEKFETPHFVVPWGLPCTIELGVRAMIAHEIEHVREIEKATE